MSPEELTLAVPCGRCSTCDERLFRAWAQRIRAGLPYSDAEDSPRTILATEILRDLGRRYPWGIAQDLLMVLGFLASALDTPSIAAGEDHSAAGILDELADMEARGRRLDPDGIGQDCRKETS